MIFVALLFAACSLRGAQAQEANIKMESLVDTALQSRGREYFEAERAYRTANISPAILETRATNADPLDLLVLRVLRQWKEPVAREFDQALGYLDTLPARIAKTPITNPSPTGISGYLSMHFGARVADLMAVHLVKQTDWPPWRVSGVLLYVRQQASPSTTAALIRFASEARDQKWFSVAVDGIRAAKDPDLGAKIHAEERQAAKEHRAVPAALRELSGSK